MYRPLLHRANFHPVKVTPVLLDMGRGYASFVETLSCCLSTFSASRTNDSIRILMVHRKTYFNSAVTSHSVLSTGETEHPSKGIEEGDERSDGLLLPWMRMIETVHVWKVEVDDMEIPPTQLPGKQYSFPQLYVFHWPRELAVNAHDNASKRMVSGSKQSP